MCPIRIVIADDELLFRKCLIALIRSAPDIEVVGEAANAPEAVSKIRELKPDVVVLDAMMSRTDDSSVVDAIHRMFPEVKILVLASFDDDNHLFSALQSGARGYMLKEAAPDELLTAIRSLSKGQAYLHPSIAYKAVRWLRQPPAAPLPSDQLTKRQREVLALVAQGCTNLEIGNRLVITEHTASKHVSSILGKLHVTHRTQAALYAVQSGQIQ